MDVEKSSLCNCVVNFLLEENYLLTAFELLHELLDDGRDNQAIRLKEFFSDTAQFPADQISRLNSLRVADPQSLFEEKESLEEKLALCEYELRLAQEDVLKLKTELEKKSETSAPERTGTDTDSAVSAPDLRQKRDSTFSNLGSMKDSERRDLNCAVKEYLLLAGYRLTAMTFYEEVTDQNLDIWQNSPACVSDALRHYYYQYLSSTTEAAEEKISMLSQNESLQQEIDRLIKENQSLLKSKDKLENQVVALMKSTESLQKEIKDKENTIQDMKQTMESQRKELNDCRAEITSLKMRIEGASSVRNLGSSECEPMVLPSSESYIEEIKSLQTEIERLKGTITLNNDSINSTNHENGDGFPQNIVSESSSSDTVQTSVLTSPDVSQSAESDREVQPTQDNTNGILEKLSEEKSSSEDNGNIGDFQNDTHESANKINGVTFKSENISADLNAGGFGAIQILSDALPKIVPFVLINHREELLPLIMCAIERHPDNTTRDSLTHTLFNLIKRPDEQQRQIIMDACVTLARNVGEMRTETELLPQCWEQINHMYEERRLLVAQSCGQLAEFVRPEIRDSLILSIVQQLIEDPATVVREAAARNLALLLPLFPNTDKHIKVEEMLFQLLCDPAGVVVEATIKELCPALIKWGDKIDHILEVLLSHILGSVQRCPPLSGVEGSVESHLRLLGERERWNIDVLLRLLTELLPFMHQKAVDTCPFSSVTHSSGTFFNVSLLELYARGGVEWPAFEWLHVDCFPQLIQLARLLPPKEDNLRNRITKILLEISRYYGEAYLTHIMLPVFFVAVGEEGDWTYFPQSTLPRLIGLKPKTAVSQRLASLGVLPLLLAGVLGSPCKHDHLTKYLKTLLFHNIDEETSRKMEIVNSIRFLCTFEEHHTLIFNILWEMVVNSNTNLKTYAANLLKSVVPYVDAKVASMHVLPALVTLGSDQNLNVKYASIEAFGTVAQHFKNDTIVDKIRIQMDAFLEDGSHEATLAVVRALAATVPHTTDWLRDYLSSKIFQLTAVPLAASNVARRRERANAFCEAIRALDATDLSVSSVRDNLIPAIQNLLKDTDALDPAHKEALEIILKERSGGAFDTISKVMGGHLGIASSVSNFFGEGGLLGKKESIEQAMPPQSPDPIPPPQPQPPLEDTRLRRIMRGGFTDMLRGKSKINEDSAPNNQ